MKVRIISSLAMLPLIAVLYIGGPLLWALSFIIAMVGIFELYCGFEAVGVRPSRKLGWILTSALYAIITINPDPDLYLLWFFVVIGSSLLYLFNSEKRQLQDSVVTAFGLIYVAFLSSHIILIDKSAKSPMIWVVVLCAFGTDVFAYFGGYLFGRHKLCPKVSPKKTVEGAIGGIVGSLVLCMIFGYLIFGESIYHFLFLGLAGSVVAQIGDLSASILKRNMGIKDFGSLIPGHGGVLDRFDSVLFTAPFVYYYIVLVMY